MKELSFDQWVSFGRIVDIHFVEQEIPSEVYHATAGTQAGLSALRGLLDAGIAHEDAGLLFVDNLESALNSLEAVNVKVQKYTTSFYA